MNIWNFAPEALAAVVMAVMLVFQRTTLPNSQKDLFYSWCLAAGTLTALSHTLGMLIGEVGGALWLRYALTDLFIVLALVTTSLLAMHWMNLAYGDAQQKRRYYKGVRVMLYACPAATVALVGANHFAPLIYSFTEGSTVYTCYSLNMVPMLLAAAVGLAVFLPLLFEWNNLTVSRRGVFAVSPFVAALLFTGQMLVPDIQMQGVLFMLLLLMLQLGPRSISLPQEEQTDGLLQARLSAYRKRKRSDKKQKAFALVTVANYDSIKKEHDRHIANGLTEEISDYLRRTYGYAQVYKMSEGSFICMLPDGGGVEGLGALHAHIRGDWLIEGAVCDVECRILYYVPDSAAELQDDLAGLLQYAADRAAEAGKLGVICCCKKTQAAYENEKQVVHKLRGVIAAGQATLCLEPVCRMDELGLRVVGASCALGFQVDPDSTVSFEDVFHIASRHNLINQLNELLLRKACELERKLQNLGLDGIELFCDISPAQLSSAGAISRIREIMEDERTISGNIKLQLSGRHIVCSPRMHEHIEYLNRRGFGLTLRGVGDIGLQDLLSLPFACVKVDYTWLCSTAGKQGFYGMVLPYFCRAGVKVIITGVEEDTPLHELMREGIYAMQGPGVIRPLLEPDFLAQLECERAASITTMA